jgi:hypothetical protein
MKMMKMKMKMKRKKKKSMILKMILLIKLLPPFKMEWLLP